jgi:hypothetical protein
MSLVLSRPRPVRSVLLPALILAGLLASALSLAPTVARTASAAAHDAVCSCANCAGGPDCCCLTRRSCPVGSR